MDWKGMFSISLPHFRSDCLTARMCVDGGQRTVLACGDVWTGQSSEPHIQYWNTLWTSSTSSEDSVFVTWRESHDYKGDQCPSTPCSWGERHGGFKVVKFHNKEFEVNKIAYAEKKHQEIQENSISNRMWSWWSSCSWWMEMDRWSCSGKDPQYTKKRNVRSKWLWRLSLWSSFDSRLERNSIEVPVECEGGQK